MSHLKMVALAMTGIGPTQCSFYFNFILVYAAPTQMLRLPITFFYITPLFAMGYISEVKLQVTIQ